jgi:hypothetical protein
MMNSYNFTYLSLNLALTAESEQPFSLEVSQLEHHFVEMKTKILFLCFSAKLNTSLKLYATSSGVCSMAGV